MANSDTIATAEQCAKDASAIVLCETCCGNYVLACDPDAESHAYALATNQWKAESRGFRGMALKEVRHVVKGVLDDANRECPSCWAR
jgi:hypothetical protein